MGVGVLFRASVFRPDITLDVKKKKKKKKKREEGWAAASLSGR